MAKVINTRIQYKYDETDNWNTCTDVSLKGELYVHVSDENSYLKVGDNEHMVKDLPYVKLNEDFNNNNNLITIAYLPEITGSYTYTGTPQKPSITNFDAITTQISGAVERVNAGTYVVRFTPREGYCWLDRTNNTLERSWTINKATPSLFVDKTDIVLQPTTKAVIQVNADNYKTLRVSSEANDIATAELEGNQIIVQGNSEGSTTITVGFDETNNTLANWITVNVTCQNKRLNDYTWQEIADLAKAGEAHKLFQVGDIKEVFLSGEVATARGTNYTINTTGRPTYVYISDITSDTTASYDTLTFTGFLQQLDSTSTDLYSVCINDPQQNLFLGFDYAAHVNDEDLGSNWYGTLSSLSNIFEQANPGLLENIMVQTIDYVRLLYSYNYSSPGITYNFTWQDKTGSHAEFSTRFTANGSSTGYSQYQQNGNTAKLYYINGNTNKQTNTTGWVSLSGKSAASGQLYVHSDATFTWPDGTKKTPGTFGWLQPNAYGGICPSFKIGVLHHD